MGGGGGWVWGRGFWLFFWSERGGVGRGARAPTTRRQVVVTGVVAPTGRGCCGLVFSSLVPFFFFFLAALGWVRFLPPRTGGAHADGHRPTPRVAHGPTTRGVRPPGATPPSARRAARTPASDHGWRAPPRGRPRTGVPARVVSPRASPSAAGAATRRPRASWRRGARPRRVGFSRGARAQIPPPPPTPPPTVAWPTRRVARQPRAAAAVPLPVAWSGGCLRPPRAAPRAHGGGCAGSAHATAAASRDGCARVPARWLRRP